MRQELGRGGRLGGQEPEAREGGGQRLVPARAAMSSPVHGLEALRGQRGPTVHYA